MDVDVVVDAAPIVAEVEDPNKLRHSMIGESETLKETSSAKEYSRKSSVCTNALACKRKENIMNHNVSVFLHKYIDNIQKRT